MLNLDVSVQTNFLQEGLTFSLSLGPLWGKRLTKGPDTVAERGSSMGRGRRLESRDGQRSGVMCKRAKFSDL